MEAVRAIDHQFRRALDFENAFVNEKPAQPRLNIVYKPCDLTTLHIGYARYFTPPPLEAVPQAPSPGSRESTNAPAINTDSPVTAERAHYFDAGVTQKIMEGWTAGVDAFYKSSHSLA